MDREEAIYHLRRKNEGKILEYQKEVDELIHEIDNIKREPRASSILVEGYISYICERLLAYRFDADVFDHLDLHSKRELLQKLGIIDKKLSKDISKVQEIRNIYAHKRKIKDQNILDELNNKMRSTHTFSLMNKDFQNRLEGFELFLTIASQILSQLNQKYNMLMIAEINKFAESLKEN